ncbi:DUF1232 domain-containing protein [Salinisphaera sp. USBA-960]|uniref:YkvA family protein n=1 Tax=Salinisphaera orenii TaxID=856731 RepID=UPI000DBE48EB|nr:DUF1232 domain-containing protein [Salifodinibacter halophilus]NNC26826.1 DUF1232 domain-containing protein [Salifodinibacter halophilus]
MSNDSSVSETNLPVPVSVRHYAGHYSTRGLWRKLGRIAGRVGTELLEKALQLYYAANKPETPPWARATAYGALGYLILPMDTVPDWLAGVGLTDDFGAITLAVMTIAHYIDADVRRQAAAKMDQWLGRSSNGH